MDKKVILISCGTRDIFGQPAFVCNASYLNAIRAAGAVPIIAGLTENVDDYAELCDGLVLTGGESVHPFYYGETFESLSKGDRETKHRMQSGCNVRRDEFEMALFDRFSKKGKPIFAICRGHQLVNAATGGKNTLNFPKETGVDHTHGVTHPILVEEDSLLGTLFGTEFVVNSYHQDCAVSCGPDMRVVARSKDGIIEAMEHQSLPIYTFQFHPERMRGDQRNPALGPDTDILFKAFLERCK